MLPETTITENKKKGRPAKERYLCSRCSKPESTAPGGLCQVCKSNLPKYKKRKEEYKTREDQKKPRADMSTSSTEQNSADSPPQVSNSNTSTPSKPPKVKKTKQKKPTDEYSDVGGTTSAKQVQATNDDSIVSKRSSARLGYFEDDFLRFFVKKPAQRSPLINRGYYIRAKAIRDMMGRFIFQDFRNEKKQIFTVGAGFDTNYFYFSSWMKQQNIENNNNVTFFEFDFDGVVARKAATIKENEPMKSLLKNQRDDTEVTIRSDYYNLTAVDLRDLSLLEKKMKHLQMDPNVVTCVLGECVINYMDVQSSDALLSFLSKTFPRLCFITYEQLHYQDAFGQVMTENLLSRGSPLLGIYKYNTVQDQINRYSSLGCNYTHVRDVNAFWRELSHEETTRIINLELFDEEEEWKIKCSHYYANYSVKDPNYQPVDMSITESFSSINLNQDSHNTTTATVNNNTDNSISWSETISSYREFHQSLARWGHSTVLVKNNFIIAFGGFGTSYQSTTIHANNNNTETHGNSNGIQEKKEPYYDKFTGKVHCRLNDIVFLDVQSMKPAISVVEGTPPTPRVFHTAVVSENTAENSASMWVFGGRGSPAQPMNDLHCLSVVFKFFPNSQNPSLLHYTIHCEWRKVEPSGNIPEPRWRHSANIVGDDMIIFGGKTKTHCFNDCWAYNTKTNQWRQLETSGIVPSPRCSHSMVVLEQASAKSKGKLLLFGGMYDTFTTLNDVYILNLDDLQWTRVETGGIPPFPRFSHSAVLVQEPNPGHTRAHLVVIGGCSPNALNDVHCLPIPTDPQSSYDWISLRVQNQPTKGTLLAKHSSHVIGNFIFVLGGGSQCFSFGSLFNSVNVLLWKVNDLPKNPNPTIIAVTPQLPAPSTTAQGSKQNHKRTQPRSSNETTRPKKATAVPVAPPSPHSDFQIKRIQVNSWEEFDQLVYNKREPVIIVGANMGKCSSLWNTQYLKSKCGEKLVSVHASNTKNMSFVTRNFTFKNMTFAELLDKIYAPSSTEQQVNNNNDSSSSAQERYYLRSIGVNPRKDVSDIWESFPEISSDFEVPSFVPMAHPQHPNYFSSAFRISSSDLQLWTHYDIMDNILCEISGAKRCVLYPPSDVDKLYVNGSSSNVVDIDNPDLVQFPKYAQAHPIEFILNAGEILFIPALWFHNMLALEPCIAVNLFWKHLDENFYEKKDLYGNKDLIPAAKAMKEAEAAIQSLQQVPEYYREFYARRILQAIKDSVGLNQ